MGRADLWGCCIPGILELAESAMEVLPAGFEEGRCSSCLPFPHSQLHYQHQVVKKLHKLWRQRLTVPSVLEEEVPLDQRSTAEDMESTLGAASARSSTVDFPRGKRILEKAPRKKSTEEEEAGPSGWNLSLDDFKQVVTSVPTS